MDNDGTCAKFTSFSIQKVAQTSGTNLQLAAETCEFAQVPSLSMSVHGTLMYLNLTFIGVNISERKSGTERTKKRKKR